VNLGQTMITMGMFILLVMSVISANRMLLDNTQATLQAEAYTASATIANDLLQEALSKRFDEFSDSYGYQSPSDFSPPTPGVAEWGPSATEKAAVGPSPDSSYTGAFKSATAFDDLDDYTGYTRMATANNISGFVITVQVYYVEASNPDVAVNYRTYYKRIAVTVQHPQYLSPVTYTALMSY
jgi:hypothetical protein